MIFTITVTVRPIFKPTRTACIIMSAMFTTFPGFPVRLSSCSQVLPSSPCNFRLQHAAEICQAQISKKFSGGAKKQAKSRLPGRKKFFCRGGFKTGSGPDPEKKRPETAATPRTQAHTPAHTHAYAHAHGRLRLHTPARIHPHICLHTRAYLRTPARIRLHLHTWAHTCTLTHTHAWEHIHGHGRKKGTPAEQITPRLRNGQEQTGTDRGSKQAEQSRNRSADH